MVKFRHLITPFFWEVKKLYKLVKFESKNIKNDSYCDAWELRRLYTFAFRRQNDAEKRSQRPRDRWEMGMGGDMVQTGNFPIVFGFIPSRSFVLTCFS